MTSLNNIEAIFTASIESIGGQQAAAHIKSISGIADCTSPYGPNVTELHSARNDRLVFKKIRPEQPEFTAFINGPYAWGFDPETNQPDHFEPQSAAMVLGHDFLILPFIWAQRYKNFNIVGTATFANTDCLKIQAENKWGESFDLFFASDTQRFAGFARTNPEQDENASLQVVYKEWKTINDLKLPSLIVITDKAGEYIYNFRELSINTIDENIFTVPDTIMNTEQDQ